MVPLAVEQGLTLVSASVMLSLISGWSIGSRLLTPIVAERSGGKPIMAAALLIQGLTVLVLFRAHDAWTFYLVGSLFGLGFGGEMSAYLVVNRQYFGAGPTSTLYGLEMMGAMLGHAVASGLAGLVLSITGAFMPVLALSMAFSVGGSAGDPAPGILRPGADPALGGGVAAGSPSHADGSGPCCEARAPWDRVHEDGQRALVDALLALQDALPFALGVDRLLGPLGADS